LVRRTAPVTELAPVNKHAPKLGAFDESLQSGGCKRSVVRRPRHHQCRVGVVAYILPHRARRVGGREYVYALAQAAERMPERTPLQPLQELYGRAASKRGQCPWAGAVYG